jgi:hypothetical protein
VTRATIHLVRLLILDWFDGPLDAIGRAAAGESYRVQHVGDPPITERSVFCLRRLHREAFEAVLDAATEAFGPASSPEWVVPARKDPTGPDSVEALLRKHLTPIDESVGFMRAGRLVCGDNDVVWVHAHDAAELETLDREAIWATLNEPGRLDRQS